MMTMTKREKYDKYESFLKLNCLQRRRLEEGIATVLSVLKEAKIQQYPGSKLMPSYSEVNLSVNINDDDWTVGVDISNGGAWTVICMEPYPYEENEEAE